MDNLKKWTNMLMGLSLFLSFLTIILFHSRLVVVLFCISISSILITIVLKLITKTVQEELDKLSMKIILLETTVMKLTNRR